MYFVKDTSPLGPSEVSHRKPWPQARDDQPNKDQPNEVVRFGAYPPDDQDTTTIIIMMISTIVRIIINNNNVVVVVVVVGSS